ncbi:MAG: VCBS repeat-containing protein, partial [Bacteroidales bacterium]|nr:VCBS repeat-containing protein [Bacteroidales bacterium]
MAADLCGDSCLDLAVGNTVYNVDIQSRTTYAANQMTVVHSVPDSLLLLTDSTAIPFRDGNTFLVDINLDGRLDVLVMNVDRTAGLLYIYVWDVGGDTLICSKKILNVRKFGIPQIGDLDNDGYPEICFVAGGLAGVQSSVYDSIYALKYNPVAAGGGLEVFWSMVHSDQSGSTGLTMFDFNQDGLVELVYRDEWNLHIINGSLIHHETGATLTQPYDLATYACGSATVFEYPVVADIDKDGSAEIVVTGTTPSSSIIYEQSGHIYIFKSGGAAWAPAREVWNQYLYYVTNVNKDLTIPLYQFDNATPFVDTLGVVRRPYNNFMQQATTIDQYGRPYYAVPDIVVDSLGESYELDSITLIVSYCNQGDNTLFAPYTVVFYEGQTGGTLLGQLTITEDLEEDSCAQQQLTLPYDSVNGVRNIVAVVNATASGIAQNGGLQAECDTVNNVLSNSRVYAVFDTTICSTEFPMMWHDSVFTEVSTKYAVLRATNGMDSVLVLYLQEILATYSVVYDTVMENDLPHYFNGQEFDEAVADSSVIITNAVGCDS